MAAKWTFVVGMKSTWHITATILDRLPNGWGFKENTFAGEVGWGGLGWFGVGWGWGGVFWGVGSGTGVRVESMGWGGGGAWGGSLNPKP